MLMLRDPLDAVATTPAPGAAAAAPASALPFFAYRTAVNARRYTTSMLGFAETQFGTGPEAPSPAHIRAVNALLKELVGRQEQQEQSLAAVAARADALDDRGLAQLTRLKARNHELAGETEKVWEFYQRLFAQRRGRAAGWLRALDQIANDCYGAVWMGLGAARPVPSPAPFAYMESGFGPATFRRGVKLSMLGARPNPFPLVKVPRHRLINPWSLGAVPHEVAHNLQNDLGLWDVLPGRIAAAFKTAGLPDANAAVWRRWHKETYADLAALLLIGPAYVGSIMDTVARSREETAAWSDEAVHPTPIIRVPLNIRLAERLGFGAEAAAFARAWAKLYPASVWARLPRWVVAELPRQLDAVIDAIVFTPAPEYGGRALADVVRFEPRHAPLVNEAATRLENGDSTSILPERFLIGAARVALARARVPPATIFHNFYATLARH